MRADPETETVSHNFPLRLPPSLKAEAERLARREGVSLNRFITSAVAERVGALRAANYFQERAARADRAKFNEVLARAGRGNPPVPGDELPAPET